MGVEVEEPIANDEPLLTTKEVAALLNCTPQTVRNLTRIANGLEYVYVGRDLRFERAAVRAFKKRGGASTRR